VKRIEITVAPDGQARVETHGFSGQDCRDASRLLEQALGKQTDERLKAEFYSGTTVTDQQHLRESS